MNAAATAARIDAESTYFYLSYTHVPPPPNQASRKMDHWVRKLFRDLEQDVWRKRAETLARAETPPPTERPALAETPARAGFCDVLVPPGADWRERVRRELGLTQVLVALYAPGYFSRSWSLGEWESFSRRLTLAGQAEPERHILPVLWVPLAVDAPIPLLDRALRLGAGIEGYVEDGLEAMARLSFYQRSYARIVGRLAEEIVRIAHEETLEPSSAPPMSEVKKIHLGTPFTVAVLAPASGGVPGGRRSEPYGEVVLDWRPHRLPDDLPIASLAATMVERLDLNAQEVEFDDGAIFDHSPGVVIIDPWVTADGREPRALADALAGQPEWVSTIVVVDSDDPQYERGVQLAERVKASLALVGRQATIARGVVEFERVLARDIVRAKNAYFKSRTTPRGQSSNNPSNRPGDRVDG